MLCDLCNGTKNIVIGNISFKSRPLGNILVPNIKYSICCVCGEKSIDYHESKKIHNYVEKKEAEAIKLLPVGDFISLNESAKILEVTKQAFNKNSRITRGFIYSVEVDGRTLYYKKSVEEFKRNGKDGRISLCASSYVREKPSNVINFFPKSSVHKQRIPKYSVPSPRFASELSYFDREFVNNKRHIRC